MSTTTTTRTVTLTEEQFQALQAVLAQATGAKPAKAGKKEKRVGSLPKGVTPPHLVKWNSYVDSVEASLKELPLDDVWEMWAATDPKDKAGNSRNTDEQRAKFKVIRQVAMAVAKARKAAGEMPAEYEHTPMSAEEKAAAKAARAATAAASSSDSDSAAPPKEKKARKPRTPKVKPAAAPAVVVAALPATPPPEMDEEDDDEDALEFSEFMLKGKKYLKLENGACWVRNADGSRGKWAGLYRAATDKIDTSALEPNLEEN